MKIQYGEKYKNSLKKIKNRHKESSMLEKIINHIKQCGDFIELSRNPISLMYGFEPLKYELNGYYSFNLNKNGGKIRLLFSTKSTDEIILEYISTDHYEDFKNRL